jgi:Ca2+-binding RTX toxin-like protein
MKPGDGTDLLLAGTDGQQISGSGDNLVIADGAGNDTITGGGGADTLGFGPNSGQDVITDFATSSNVLDVRQTAVGSYGFSGIPIMQSGNDTIVDLGGGYSVTLLGVNASALSADNFIFNV